MVFRQAKACRQLETIPGPRLQPFSPPPRVRTRTRPRRRARARRGQLVFERRDVSRAQRGPCRPHRLPTASRASAPGAPRPARRFENPYILLCVWLTRACDSKTEAKRPCMWEGSSDWRAIHRVQVGDAAAAARETATSGVQPSFARCNASSRSDTRSTRATRHLCCQP
jgi:hypothetical protein